MTRLLVLAVLVALLGLTAASSSVAAVDLAKWSFDSSGTLGVDSSGHGYDLNNSGVVFSADKAPSAPGAGSAYFDENQTQFSTSVGFNLSSATVLSISWWAKPEDTSDVGFIFEQGSPNFLSHAMAIGADWETGAPGTKRMNLNIGNGQGGCWVFGINAANDDQWHFYEAIIDRNATSMNDFVKFYRDGVNSGVLLADGGTNFNQPFYDGTNGDGKLYVGSRADVLNVNRYQGYIDELTFADVTAVPEPSAFVGLSLMFGMLGAAWRKIR